VPKLQRNQEGAQIIEKPAEKDTQEMTDIAKKLNRINVAEDNVVATGGFMHGVHYDNVINKVKEKNSDTN